MCACEPSRGYICRTCRDLDLMYEMSELDMLTDQAEQWREPSAAAPEPSEAVDGG